METIQFTLDRNRYKQNFIIHNWVYQTGTIESPTIQDVSDVKNYGMYFIGNGGLNTSIAHKDILYYNSDGSSLDIGTGTYTQVSGNIDNTKGSCSFWIDTTNLSADIDLFKASDTFNIRWDNTNSDIVFDYGASSITSNTSGDIHVKVSWYESNFLYLAINGTEETPINSDAAPTLDSSFTINQYISKIFITSEIDTPQIPTVNKEPIHIPIMEKS